MILWNIIACLLLVISAAKVALGVNYLTHYFQILRVWNNSIAVI